MKDNLSILVSTVLIIIIIGHVQANILNSIKSTTRVECYQKTVSTSNMMHRIKCPEVTE